MKKEKQKHYFTAGAGGILYLHHMHWLVILIGKLLLWCALRRSLEPHNLTRQALMIIGLSGPAFIDWLPHQYIGFRLECLSEDVRERQIQ